MSLNRGERQCRRRRGALCAAVCVLVALAAGAAPAPAITPLTIGPATPVGAPTTALPFGRGSSWTPFHGFHYNGIPAFELRTGDVVAFDLAAVNDSDIQLLTQMGSAQGPMTVFHNVVSNAVKAAAPRGNTVVGDYELAFTVDAPIDAPFYFPGGGLVIRFSSPSATYLADASPTVVLPGVDATDPSGFFSSRFTADADGLPPYGVSDTVNLAAFRLTFNRTCAGRPVTIIGNQRANFPLNGTSGPDVIAAYETVDVVNGGKGKDVICGGDGKDILRGGPGKDKLLGEAGTDRLRGGKGKDKLIGGPGNDDLRQ